MLREGLFYVASHVIDVLTGHTEAPGLKFIETNAVIAALGTHESFSTRPRTARRDARSSGSVDLAGSMTPRQDPQSLSGVIICPGVRWDSGYTANSFAFRLMILAQSRKSTGCGTTIALSFISLRASCWRKRSAGRWFSSLEYGSDRDRLARFSPAEVRLRLFECADCGHRA
jgi:hypothetical protein